MKIHYNSPCSLLMLMILFLTHTRDQAAATARLLEAEELSYSLIDIEQLEVDNFNTSLYWDTPTYTAPFTNSSFSKQLTFYVRFCFLNRHRHDLDSVVTIFALKYSTLYNGSNYNCSMSIKEYESSSASNNRAVAAAWSRVCVKNKIISIRSEQGDHCSVFSLLPNIKSQLFWKWTVFLCICPNRNLC